MSSFEKIFICIKKFYISNMVLVWLFGIDILYLITYLSFPGIDIVENLFSEIIGMNITVIILDTANKNRADIYDANYAFENDIQSYGRFLFNLGNRVQAIREMINNNIENGLIFKAKQDLKIFLDNPPVTRSFVEKRITKDRGKRITKATSYAQTTIQRLDELLSQKEISKVKYVQIEGELFRAGMSIIELRASNKFISDKGSILDGVEE